MFPESGEERTGKRHSRTFKDPENCMGEEVEGKNLVISENTNNILVVYRPERGSG